MTNIKFMKSSTMASMLYIILERLCDDEEERGWREKVKDMTFTESAALRQAR